ncbi:hypothetical protein [Ornithinimicrobium kibberense]|uniref:hypothetical protein n=1 Tax=Ornithinimicrobium kibberense TaxID=282060 RepID=UPI0036194024
MRAADVVGRGGGQDTVDDGRAVEPGHDGQPPGDRGRLVTAGLLHPPHVQLDVHPMGGQRVDVTCGAPGQEGAQV